MTCSLNITVKVEVSRTFTFFWNRDCWKCALNTVENNTRATGRTASWKKVPEWSCMDEKKQDRMGLPLTVPAFITLIFTVVIMNPSCSFCVL